MTTIKLLSQGMAPRWNRALGAGVFILAALGVFLASPLPAATNDLTTLLQQGLFEEEANRDLNAAIARYQSLATEFDKDRQIAATAVFRLGECYRKLGRTNEAIAQYERVRREFSDQPTLVTLSGQNLAGLGAAEPSSGAVDSRQLTDLESQYQFLKLQVEQAHAATDPYAVARIFEDEEFKQALEASYQADLKAVWPGGNAPKPAPELFENKRLALAKVNALMTARFKKKEQELQVLRLAIAHAKAGQPIPLSMTLAQAETAEAEAASLKKQIAELTGPDQTQRRITAQKFSLSYPALAALYSDYSAAGIQLNNLTRSSPTNEPGIREARSKVERINQQLDKQIDDVLADLKKDMEAARESAVALRASATRFETAPSTTSAEPAITDEEKQEIRRIQLMIKNSPDLINAPNADRMTPLCLAASRGQLRVAEYLLKAGADVNVMASGMSPLHYAAFNGHKKMVELLVSQGAELNAQDTSDKTPLHLAAERGFLSVAETLLKAKADPNIGERMSASPLTLAAQKGPRSMVALLLTYGANPNMMTKLPPNWGVNPLVEGRTIYGGPLHFAAVRNDPAMTALLLSNRADVTLRNLYDESPLDIASILGRTEVAAQLIAAGADVNSPGPGDRTGGSTPLHYATGNRRVEIVRLLLEHGASPNVTALYDGNRATALYDGSRPAGVTPLMLAAGNGDLETAKLLLDHKADVNAEDGEGQPVLWRAVRERKADVTRLLLAHGADPNWRNRQSFPLLITAVADFRDKDVVDALLQGKADVNIRDSRGQTALHYAVQVDREDLARLLLDAGADPNARDNQGATPLDNFRTKAPSSARGIPTRIPSLPLPPVPGPPLRTADNTSEKAVPSPVAELLRQHGALEQLPNFSTIQVNRPARGNIMTVFTANADSLNRYTVMEAVLDAYGRGPTYRSQSILSNGRQETVVDQTWAFPDLSRLIIHRPNRTLGGKEQEIPVNILNATNGFDCAKDTWLEFGDVLEIPVRIHALDEPSLGLSRDQQAAIGACLSRKIKLTARGQTRILSLEPTTTGSPLFSFYLSGALQTPEAVSMLFSSSDMTRVKVIRKDQATTKTNEFIMDITASNRTPDRDLLLRDGDVIDVPEK